MEKIKITNGTITREVTKETYVKKWSTVGYTIVPENEVKQNKDDMAFKVENESLKVENAKLKSEVERLENELLEYKADTKVGVNNDLKNNVVEAVAGEVLEVSEVAEGTEVKGFESQEGDNLEVVKETKPTYTAESLKGLKKPQLTEILINLDVVFDTSDTNDELRNLILENCK